VSLGLAALSYAAITRDGPAPIVAALLGVAALVAFVLVERASSHPMLPLRLFRSPQFTGTNLTTLAVYAGLGGVMFLLVIQLQEGLGYSALEAGAALVPFTGLMLVVSPSAGSLSQRIGPRIPLTVGPLIAASGIALLAQVTPGDSYVTGVLPGVLVLGLGMSVTVAPLTSAVLASVDDDMSGTASGVNNAVARLAGLVAVAVLPGLAGIGPDFSGGLGDGYQVALLIGAATTALGALAAVLLVRDATVVVPTRLPSVYQPCGEPCLEETREAS
jgi:MFS family permease